MLAQMAVSKSVLDENKQQQDMQHPLHPRVSEAQCCRALSIDQDRSLQVLEGCFADEAVVADALDVKQTSQIRCDYIESIRKSLSFWWSADVVGYLLGITTCRCGIQ